MRYVFGPVPSRRLGYSLGVDIIPPKYCTYDCIYCQIGKTTDKDIRRKSFYDPGLVADEVAGTVASTRVDVITFSGSGEPTLNSDLGTMIRKVKEKVDTPVAVITNGSLLHEKDVRADLAEADVVLPSLDAVTEEVFRKVNRPQSFLDIGKIIEGLKEFRAGYAKPIWLEIMLIKNINDDPDELRRMVEIVSSLGVDRIQLNTVTRPPSEETAGRIEKDELKQICELFGPRCEVICSFEKTGEIPAQADWTEIILETLKRHPLTLADVVRTTSLSRFQARTRLKAMEKKGLVKSYVLGDDLFYVVA
ncbi:MAG: molybdenum cofactor biosynthesis protein A [Syntrophorhabdus sp. PtaB.Bin184]|jgi:wyosine [tRNA(Phe)-imidazoG37] synthetase (radical SAM superfamily)|nr:MAG: molybdenum cofactor biosynthesis protein A [Syntrophorhabdus sp. PtaB.Bin184]